MNAIARRSAKFNRVLIVDNQGMMGAGVERLLAADLSLEVIGVVAKNEATLVKEIWRLQPDTIILTLESHGASPLLLLELLYDYGRLRIIVVSAKDNTFEVYDKQQIITNPAALIDQIKRDSSLPTNGYLSVHSQFRQSIRLS